MEASEYCWSIALVARELGLSAANVAPIIGRSALAEDYRLGTGRGPGKLARCYRRDVFVLFPQYRGRHQVVWALPTYSVSTDLLVSEAAAELGLEPRELVELATASRGHNGVEYRKLLGNAEAVAVVPRHRLLRLMGTRALVKYSGIADGTWVTAQMVADAVYVRFGRQLGEAEVAARASALQVQTITLEPPEGSATLYAAEVLDYFLHPPSPTPPSH